MKARLRRRTKDTAPDPVESSAPHFISVIYEDVRHIAGPIVDNLIESDRRAAARLLDSSLYFMPLLRALQAFMEHFDRLAGLDGLDPDIAALFRQASGNVYDGILACTHPPGPRVMDESRFLMEVEFLLYDLAARPESLGEWRDAEPHRRNQNFGFGKLRARRERDLGVEPTEVLPDRDEYSVHSANVHPRPAHELMPPDETPDARRTHLMVDLGDLFGHATRVASAAIPAVEVFLDAFDPAAAVHPAAPEDPEPFERATRFVAEWRSRFSVPDRPASVPIKRDTAASIQPNTPE